MTILMKKMRKAFRSNRQIFIVLGLAVNHEIEALFYSRVPILKFEAKVPITPATEENNYK